MWMLLREGAVSRVIWACSWRANRTVAGAVKAFRAGQFTRLSFGCAGAPAVVCSRGTWEVLSMLMSSERKSPQVTGV